MLSYLYDYCEHFRYDIKENISLGITWVYGTGNAISLPIGSYQGFGDNFNPYDVGKGDDFRGLSFGGYGINYYESRNSWRMPSYHRADISLTYINKETKKYKSSWNFSVYNIYNRMNPYFIYFNEEGGVDTQDINFTAKQVSLFPVLPSVTWNFNF